MSSLINYEPHVNDCADLYCTRLNELAEARVPMNIGHWMQCYAFDVIGAITYSKRLGFLDQGLDIGNVIGALEGFLGYATMTGPSCCGFLVRFFPQSGLFWFFFLSFSLALIRDLDSCSFCGDWKVDEAMKIPICV